MAHDAHQRSKEKQDQRSQQLTTRETKNKLEIMRTSSALLGLAQISSDQDSTK